MSEELSEWMTARAAAKVLGVHENSIRNWAREGYIRTREVGPSSNIKRYSGEDVENILAARDDERDVIFDTIVDILTSEAIDGSNARLAAEALLSPSSGLRIVIDHA